MADVTRRIGTGIPGRRRALAGVLGGLWALFALTGCSDITGPRWEAAFEWGEVDDPTTVQESVNSSVALGDLFLLGQFNTPTRCYVLDSDVQKRGSNLTIRVRATTNNPSNCDQSLGGFRYTIAVYNLEDGEYNLVVYHEIEGGNGKTFSRTVEI